MRPLVRHQGQVRLFGGDSRDVLKTFPDSSIDSVVCDPPYALTSVLERFGADDAAPAKYGEDGLFQRSSAGFMGMKWDTGETAFAVSFWQEVLRILKPGGYVVAFGGTRTYHHLAMAIELAGFEVRDQLGWLYGTGFPKSHTQPDGTGTAIKPAWEPICLAQKPFKGTFASNIAAHGVGGLRIAECRVEGENGDSRFPANVLHDGSAEAVAFLPEGAERYFYSPKATKADREEGCEHLPEHSPLHGADGLSGGYSSSNAKAAKRNNHPTVKPTGLMRWLVRLVTPRGGVVLDPFMGSGSTGKAALFEGCQFIGVEAHEDYMPIAEARIAFAARAALPPPPPDPDLEPVKELEYEGY